MFFERNQPSLASGLGIVVTSCLLVNILGIAYQFLYVMQQGSSNNIAATDHARDLASDIRTVNLKFHDDPSHYDLTGTNASVEWSSLQPEGNGVVFLGDSHKPYEVSVWHQLRCLNHIRAFMNSENGDYQRTKHCFHYLRQSILCAADTTLEPIRLAPGPAPAGGRLSSSDDGVVHTCRDWSQVFEMTESSYKRAPSQVKSRVRASLSSHGRPSTKASDIRL
ncbi:hypothetical protein HGRIS_002051 [Hohenbuehelia grisea]|uniref:Uncharacterized protein n=1 Tax=Hohenbuehelia grisea TaxID=104357 RepID=A0ABR3JJ96_9AGAR